MKIRFLVLSMLKCKKSENVKKNEEVMGVELPVSARPILCFEGHKVGKLW